MMNYCELCGYFGATLNSGVIIAALRSYKLTGPSGLSIMRKTLCLLVATAGLLAAGAVCAAPGDVVLGAQSSLPSVHGLVPSVSLGGTSLASGSGIYRHAPETGAKATQTVDSAPAEERDGGSMLLAGAILIVALVVKRISG
jgi:hypothetical protein